jgi:hypothetical protein
MKTRLAFIVMLGPRLIDPRAKVDHFIGLFRYSEEKEKVQEVLKARSDVLNANLFRQPAFLLNGNGNIETNTNSTENALKNKQGSGAAKPFMGLVARERVTKPIGKSQISIGRQNLGGAETGIATNKRVTTETMSISRPDQGLLSLGNTKENSIGIKEAQIHKSNLGLSSESPSLQPKQMVRTLAPLQTDFDTPDDGNSDSEVIITKQFCNRLQHSIVSNTARVTSASNSNDNSNGHTLQQHSKEQNIKPIIQNSPSGNSVISSVAKFVGSGKVQLMIKSFSKFSPSSSQVKEATNYNDDLLVESDSATGNINNILNIHAQTAARKQNKEANRHFTSQSVPPIPISLIQTGENDDDNDSPESWRDCKTQKSVKSLAEDYYESNSKRRPSLLQVKQNSTDKIENGGRNIFFGTRDNEIKTRPVSGSFNVGGQYNRHNNVNSSSSSNIVDLSVYQHMAAEGPVDCNEEGTPLFRFDELVRMNFVKKYEGIKQSELIYSMVNEDFLEHFGSTKVLMSLMISYTM